MVEIIDQEGRQRRYFDEFICEICGEIFCGSWTDFHGQATCNNCGAPYQLKSYNGSKPDEKFPRLDLNEQFKAIMKEYWQQTKKRCRLGAFMILRDYPGVIEEQRALADWCKTYHPEALSTEV